MWYNDLTYLINNLKSYLYLELDILQNEEHPNQIIRNIT